MKYDWFEEYCTSKKGAYKEYKSEWEVDRYMIRDKMFVMHGGDKDGKEIITIKLEPMYGQILREQYSGDIVPGYYMNKEHWNSIYVKGNVPEGVLRDTIDKSYALVFGTFSKKVQKQIMETELIAEGEE